MTLNIGFVLFPNLTQLDLTVPAQVLSRLGRQTLHFVSRDLEPVPTDSGFSLIPTVRWACTFEWPRTGQIPAPGLPILPRISRRLTNICTVSTPARC